MEISDKARPGSVWAVVVEPHGWWTVSLGNLGCTHISFLDKRLEKRIGMNFLNHLHSASFILQVEIADPEDLAPFTERD